jgi:Tol biopolymer transport system component
MKKFSLLALTLLLAACSHHAASPAAQPAVAADPAPANLLYPGEEKHLKNIKQLTFGGQNAEAYFSADGRWLTFQSERDGYPCDQQYVMRTDGSQLRRVSTGTGRTTCGYIVGDDPISPNPDRLIFSSTHDYGAECPAKPDYSKGYVWPIYNTFEIYGEKFGGGKLTRMTKNKFYDAESTVSPDQREIVFTSTRHGDLDLYVMNVDGTHVRQVTKDLGYDGGAFFTHDGERLIYRAYHPQTAAEKKSYKEDLKNGLYRPTWLELFIIGKNGKNKHQITHLQGGTFAPYMFPNDKRVIFASNYKNPRGRQFNIYAIDVDGQNLEQITYSGTFDSFPMFSPDGKKIVWASNRNGKVPHETNIFIADWVD